MLCRTTAAFIIRKRFRWEGDRMERKGKQWYAYHSGLSYIGLDIPETSSVAPTK